MANQEAPASLEQILGSVEEKLSILESQKAEIEEAIQIKRASIKEMRQTLDSLHDLEERLLND